MKRVAFTIATIALLFSATAFAVQPDEILQDEALEKRARAISAQLRCLVCQNQSIDESDASLAKDLRILIRDLLTQNKSDPEIMDFVVARYGEYILLKPRFEAQTLVLWLTPFLLLAGGAIFLFRRRQPAAPASLELTDQEKHRLEEVLNGKPSPASTKEP